MTSREIVYRAIEQKSPPSVPVCYYNRDQECGDTHMINCGTAADFVENVPGASEWGYVWERIDGTMGQPSFAPLDDPSRIADYSPPDPRADGRLSHVRDAINCNSDKFIKFGLGITGFNQAAFLRGFENFLIDLQLDRPRAEQVLDIVFNFENGIIRQLGEYKVDAVVFGDDWGTQNGLLVSPAVWREVFLPRYAQQFKLAHSIGKKVWFHSCGYIYDIIGDLIGAGVDVLELLQPDVLRVDRLAADFGGKVCFCCSVDHQRRALSGSRDEIFAYAQFLNERLGCYDGGFIAYIEDYACLGMSEQNYQWIREAFHNL